VSLVINTEKVIGPNTQTLRPFIKRNKNEWLLFLKGEGETYYADQANYEVMKTNFAITKPCPMKIKRKRARNLCVFAFKIIHTELVVSVSELNPAIRYISCVR
jgi:hypothetical protein